MFFVLYKIIAYLLPKFEISVRFLYSTVLNCVYEFFYTLPELTLTLLYTQLSTGLCRNLAVVYYIREAECLKFMLKDQNLVTIFVDVKSA